MTKMTHKNGAQEQLEREHVSKAAPGWVVETKSFAFLGPFGAMWVSPLNKMGATGVPESNNFGTRMLQNIKKYDSRKGVKNHHISS